MNDGGRLSGLTCHVLSLALCLQSAGKKSHDYPMAQRDVPQSLNEYMSSVVLQFQMTDVLSIIRSPERS